MGKVSVPLAMVPPEVVAKRAMPSPASRIVPLGMAMPLTPEDSVAGGGGRGALDAVAGGVAVEIDAVAGLDEELVRHVAEVGVLRPQAAGVCRR